MAKKDITPGEMREVDVKFVSLVSKGANKKRFQIFKSAGADQDEAGDELENEEAKQAVGFFKQMKAFFTGQPATIEKAETVSVQEPATFAAVIDAEEARNQMWRIFDAISTVFWNILRSDAANKRDLVSKSLDEFKKKVLENFDKLNATTPVKKSDDAAEQVEIEKAGKKISAARLQALKDARLYLDQVITDAEPAANAEIQKGEDIDMKADELAALISKSVGDALAPVTARLDAIEKGDKGEGDETPAATPAAGEAVTAEAIAKSVKDAIGEAVTPLTQRIEKMETARGISNQDQDGEGNRKPVEKGEGDGWGGLFGLE